jgi:hypothetical protein
MYYANFCPTEMQKPGQRCTDLISMTANSLSGNVIALMLLAVQKDNLEPNIKQAINWYVVVYCGTRRKGVHSHYRTHAAFERGHRGLDAAIKKCLLAFPSLWVSCNAAL